METNVIVRAGSKFKIIINSMKSKPGKLSRIAGIIFTIVLILKNPFVACTNANSSFYNQVLNDFDTTSYFIAVDINSPYYKGRAIIENNNLYQYLNKTKGFDKEKYIYFMKGTLRHHRALKITDKAKLLDP